MALQKTVTTDQGVDANYHRVSDVKLYLEDDTFPRVVLEVALFKDSSARSGGSKKLKNQEYEITGADFTTYFAPAALDVVNQNPQERAYTWLKTQTTPTDFTTGTTDV